MCRSRRRQRRYAPKTCSPSHSISLSVSQFFFFASFFVLTHACMGVLLAVSPPAPLLTFATALQARLNNRTVSQKSTIFSQFVGKMHILSIYIIYPCVCVTQSALAAQRRFVSAVRRCQCKAIHYIKRRWRQTALQWQ